MSGLEPLLQHKNWDVSNRPNRRQQQVEVKFKKKKKKSTNNRVKFLLTLHGGVKSVTELKRRLENVMKKLHHVQNSSEL